MNRTDSRRRPTPVLHALVLAAAAYAAPAQAYPMDANAFAQYGGEFSINCADPRLPRLKVTADSLVYEQGGRRVSATPLDLMASYMGPEPPPEFMIAIFGPTKRGNAELGVVLQRDAKGRYARIEGDDKFVAALGKPLAESSYRDCDTERARRDGAAFVEDQRLAAVAQAEAEARSPMRDARFKAAYDRALGARAREPWIEQMVGQETGPKTVQLGGAPYRLYEKCKPHDCADNHLVLLYSADRGVAYGRLRDRGQLGWLGSPSAALAGEIDKLMREAWGPR